MEIFRGTYMLPRTGIVECSEMIIDVGCNLKQFDDLTDPDPHISQQIYATAYVTIPWSKNTLWGKKTDCTLFYFLNNFVKSRSTLIFLAHRYLNEFATKQWQNYPPLLMNVITLPCETQSVHNHSNATIKRHDKLTVTTNTSQQCSECLPFALTCALRRFRHWLIAWSVMLCCIPDHAKIVSSGTFAECLCVWCVPLTSAKCQFPWRSDG